MLKDNTKPCFSVVIPIYNKEPHIVRSISSVLNQTVTDFELLLICDPSTDNSNAEVAKFSDPRIRIFYRDEPGPGGYAARNLGIKEARAEWVAFLDADDEWHPEHLEKLQQLSSKFPHASVMGCGCEILEGEGNGKTLDSYHTKNRGGGDHYLSFHNYLEAEVMGLRPLNGTTACIRKSTLFEAGCFPAGKADRGGDVDTWLRCIEKAGGIAYGDYIGATYYRDSVNMVTRTQTFLAQVERDSVKDLLFRYSGDTAKLLKKFANTRTVSAWRKNKQIKVSNNFILASKLYYKEITFKQLVWLIISIFPESYFECLRVLKRKVRTSYLPMLKASFFGDLLRFGRAWFFRLTSRPKLLGASCSGEKIFLSDKNNPTFFGYHDKTPFSGDGSKVLAMSIHASDKDPASECSEMNLGYFKKHPDGSFATQFIRFSRTTTWCWQQGCMLQWHPLHTNTQVFYNALVDGKYGSVIFDLDKGEITREYNYPIYSLDPTGNYAVTLNFARLGRLRPGYGYALLEDVTAAERAPEDDGLYLLDLKKGTRRLLVSLAELAETGDGKAAQHYVNHASFSLDGQRIVFFHLWANEGDRGRGLRVCEYRLDKNCWQVIEAELLVSHYCWQDANSFLATARDELGVWKYILYDLAKTQKKDLELPLNEDLHPMYHPSDINVIVVDGYPNKRRDQNLCVVNTRDKVVKDVGLFYSSPLYRGQIRCDLHSRWDRQGMYIAIDTTHTGKRKLALVRYE